MIRRLRFAVLAVLLIVPLVLAQVVGANAHAGLASLALSDVTLSPAFDSDTTSYTATVPNGVSVTTITSSPADPDADVTTSPDDADDKTSGHQVNLAVGAGNCTAGSEVNCIKVTVESGATTTVYSIAVTRIADDDASLTKLELSGVTLTPAFDAATTTYTGAAANDLDAEMDGVQDQTTVTATPVMGASVRLITPVDANPSMSGHQVKLAVGDTPINVTTLAADGSTTSSYTVTVTRAGSTDATLKALTLSGVTLKPMFAADTTAYTATVPFGVDETTVTATATHAEAEVEIGGTDADAEADGEQRALTAGDDTTITITVTAEDTSETQAYTVVVTRGAPTENDARLRSLALSGITLNPTFSRATTSYTATVLAAVEETTVSSAVAVAGNSAAVTVPSADADADKAGFQVDLTAAADTTITVTVTHGTFTRTYTVVVTRIAATDASLTKLELSGVTLTPAFDAATTTYTGAAANDLDAEMDGVQDQTTVTATPVMGASVRLITPVDANPSMSGHQVKLAVGDTPINVTTLAADGSTTSSYTVTVTRAASTDATLKALTLSGVTLKPAFAADTTAYTATVPYEVDETTVTAMATHAEAEVAIDGTDADAEADGEQRALVVGANTAITITVTAEDGTTTTTPPYTVTITRNPSADATLMKLSLATDGGDAVTLSPDFASNITMYAASVASTVTSVTVTSEPAVTETRVAVSASDGATVSGGDVTLANGENTIEVEITSTDESTTTTYMVKVVKEHATAMLSEAPSVGDGIKVTQVEGTATEYMATVDRSVTQVTVTASAVADATAVITPVDAADDMAGHQVDLAIGANPITIKVTEDATPANATTYTLTVTRTPSSDAMLSALSLSGLTLEPAFDSGTTVYSAEAAHDVASTTVMATAMHEGAMVSGDGAMDLMEGANTIKVMVTAEDGMTMTYTIVVTRAAPPTTVEVPGPTRKVEVPGPTRTVTRTETKTVTVEVPAQPNVVGGSAQAMATEVDGRVLITRHDGGPSLVVDIGGFIRDETLGQTYQVVRRADGMIVRQWVSPNSPLVYQINWAVVNSAFTVPVGVVGAIPLDDQSGSDGQLVRRFDGGDDRIFSYAMGQWRHVPNIPTFQALGLYWCDVTAADADFFNRITIGAPHPATDMAARDDYPSCSTG